MARREEGGKGAKEGGEGRVYILNIAKAKAVYDARAMAVRDLYVRISRRTLFTTTQSM